uniref:A-kinase anchor protein 2 C-terminal domain-containing protein n=1 Tax=Astyanax mexicanus TaxID=7994 RepID=A0A3B1KAQ7_ASTMX
KKKKSPDDSKLKCEKSLKSVTFLDPISVNSSGNMELETQKDNHPTSGQNGVRHRGEALDSEVAQEIRYLDEVLEANCYDPAAEMTSNGTCSPELQAISVDGTGPSVHVSDVSSAISHELIVEGKKQTTYVEDNLNSTKPNGHSRTMSDDSDRSPETGTTIKKEARFELRAFHEEKRPSKLFDTPTDKEIRVKKVRPSEEVAELEKERLELIREQAVKKNPGIAAKWWNPPQEKSLEDELDPEKLESLRKYEERKQKKPETVSFAQPEVGNKEDIVVQGIDFSSARQQFLQMEHSKQQQQHHQPAVKRSVAPQIYSAKPFSRNTDFEKSGSSITVTGHSSRVLVEDGGEMSKESEVKNDDFTCARAVMTIFKDEDSDLYQRSMNSSYHPEEIDSGLDDLSLRSQDTTVLETLSNDFSMDNISDSGASNETMSAILENSLGDFSFPCTPVATTPINGKLEGGTKSPGDQGSSCIGSDSLTEEELEYHAGILVQNAIQQAIAHQTEKWQPLQAIQQSSPISERHMELSEPSPLPSPSPSPAAPEEKSPQVSPPKESYRTEEKKTSPPKITVQVPAVRATPAIPVNTYRPPSPSPPPCEKPEFSYFSKYSEAAELRSTASVTRAQDTEVTAGPFKLRSRKQRTLSMIEEEIRAAQEREEELRRQRQAQSIRPNPSAIAKQKTNSLPAKLVLTGKQHQKIRVPPPVSPSSSNGAPSPLSDLGSDDSGGSQRPKNFMQTLMEDYETHKVKRREKQEDNSVSVPVLEATRVTRRKSNMALRWEAGIYANQD